jgi:hypothetical protein
VSDVAGHRQRLEINLRPHHRGAEIEHHSPFELGHRFREHEKIAVTCRAEGSTVAVGVLVQDVVADADVDRNGDSEPHRGGQDADVLVRKRAVQDRPAERLAQPQTGVGTASNDVIHPPGFLPEAKFARADVAGHALCGGADEGEFPVVNRSGAVHADVRDQAAFHHVDEIAADSGAEDVSAHQQNTGPPVTAGSRQAFTQKRNSVVLVRRQRRVERNDGRQV